MKVTARNPDGVEILFDEETHTYTIPKTGQQLESVTTFIGGFFPKFDADAVAPKCVGRPKYKGLTVEQIKALWEKEGDRGRTEGTHTHFFAECLGEGRLDELPEPQSDRESKLFNQVAPALLDLETRFVFIGSEIIVFSPYFGIAGTIDLLMYDPVVMDLILLDWKQNKTISIDNPWESGKPPLQKMEASEFNKYALQLNVYERIMKFEGYYKFPGFNRVRKALIHLREDNYQFIKLPDMQSTVNKMFAHAGKEEIPF